MGIAKGVEGAMAPKLLANLVILGFEKQRHIHKLTAWGCSRIPNAEKLVIIREKNFKIWAKYTATFTCK